MRPTQDGEKKKIILPGIHWIDCREHSRNSPDAKTDLDFLYIIVLLGHPTKLWTNTIDRCWEVLFTLNLCAIL